MVPVGPPKTVTVEDSFKGCPTIEAARRVVKVLAPDLLARLQEEHEVCCAALPLLPEWRPHVLARGPAWTRSSQ